MHTWAGHPDLLECQQGYREEYLNEMLCGEARRLPWCQSCLQAGTHQEGLYRCESCFGRSMFCLTCCLKQHTQTPLHVIQVCFKALPADL